MYIGKFMLMLVLGGLGWLGSLMLELGCEYSGGLWVEG